MTQPQRERLDDRPDLRCKEVGPSGSHYACNLPIGHGGRWHEHMSWDEESVEVIEKWPI